MPFAAYGLIFKYGYGARRASGCIYKERNLYGTRYNDRDV